MRTQTLFIKKMTALAMALMFLLVSSVKRVEAAPTPDLTPQQIEQITQTLCNLWMM